jgi:hypothetical protein
LSSSAPSEIAAARSCEIVVGIGGDADARIGPLARAASAGLELSDRSGCLIVATAASAEQTLEQVRGAVGEGRDVGAVAFHRPPVDPLRAPYHGLPGRPAAIRAVLGEARARGAAACIFVDDRLTSVTPEWIVRMAEPVLAGDYDYVAPLYARPAFEGALTKSVVYPVFRSLYGARLRQPASGEFACSSRFIDHVLNESFWERDEAETGIDLWLASSAVTGRLRLCAVSSGVRTHAAAADAPDLNATVAQVVGPLFADVEARAHAWQRIRSSGEVPCIGPAIGSDPAAVPDVDRMLDAYRLGYRALRDVWAWILPPKTILHLRRVADTTGPQAWLVDELWAEIVYDFALMYRARRMPRDHLLGCFTPLYLAWLAGFVTEVRDNSAIDPDERIERLCTAFEAKKAHLIAGWRWPERFRA